MKPIEEIHATPGLSEAERDSRVRALGKQPCSLVAPAYAGAALTVQNTLNPEPWTLDPEP